MLFFVPIAMGLSFLVKNGSFTPLTRFGLAGLTVFILVTLGHSTYVRNSSWKTETSLWTDAVQKAPDQFRSHHNLGLAFQEKGQLHEAIREFEKAIRSPVLNRKNETVVAYYQLGKAYHALGEYEKAKGLYERALEMDPNLPAALCQLAILYEAEGNTLPARGYLEHALRIAPTDPYVNFNIGLLYLKQGDLNRAWPHFNVGVEEERLRSSAYLYMGIIAKQIEQFGRAVICLRAAVNANPKDITPRLQLIEIYQTAGLEERSLEEGKTVAVVFVRDEALFYQTVNLIRNKGGLKDVHLSGSVIFPVLQAVFDRNSEKYDEYADCLKKALEENVGLRE
jgi:tetratricopeptide (TPR) repeat protein